MVVGRVEFIVKWTVAWMKQGLPLEAFGHWIRQRVREDCIGGGVMPLGPSLRRDYVPIAAKRMLTKIRELVSTLQSEGIALIVDETPDSIGRNVLAFMMALVTYPLISPFCLSSVLLCDPVL